MRVYDLINGKKLNQLRKSKSVINITKLFSGTLIGQAISVLMLPIASRLYGVDAYGDLAIINSLAALQVGVLGFGLGPAIMVTKKDEDAQDIVIVSIVLSLILSLFVYTILILISPYYKVFEVSFGYVTGCTLILITVNLRNMNKVFYTWLNRSGKYNVLLVNPIITPLTNYIFILLFAFVGIRNSGLIIALIISQLFTFIHMCMHINMKFQPIGASKIIGILKKNRKFVVYQYPASLTNIFSAQAPVLVLSSFYNSTIVGYYSMAQKLLNIPISLLGGSINRVYFRNASAVKNQKQDATSYSYNIARKLLLLYAIPTVILVAWGDVIVPIVLGEEWTQAGDYIRVMMIWNMFLLIVNSLAGYSAIIGRQKRNLLVSITILVSDIVVMVILSTLTNKPIITLVGFVINHVLIHVIFFNSLFSENDRLKNKYMYLSFSILTFVVFVSYMLRLLGGA